MPLGWGKHLCTEEDVELVPMEKIVTILPEDTFGISKLLPDYRVETRFRKVNEHVTEVIISHYYSTSSLKARLFNLIGKRKIASETSATLNSIKAQIERGVSPLRLEVLSKHAHRLAQIGICVQFLALVRTLAEFFRLEHVEGLTLRVATVALRWCGIIRGATDLDRSALLLLWSRSRCNRRRGCDNSRASYGENRGDRAMSADTMAHAGPAATCHEHGGSIIPTGGCIRMLEGDL